MNIIHPENSVLLLGGTGAMGTHVANILSQKGYRVYVTSRKLRNNVGSITYIQGNAKDEKFLKELCVSKWYSIVDFLQYDLAELRSRINVFLQAAEQYVFISSARVYADKDIITEDSPRLLDTSLDNNYLQTNEYALKKAREEDMFFNSAMKNWTIVRPSLTYAENRLQLGVYEKENWLYRALKGRSIVFSKDLMDKYYTLSYGRDVAEGIVSIIGNADALSQVFNIVSDKSFQWKDILNIYLDKLENATGKRPRVIITDLCTNLAIPFEKYQVLYGRYYNRHFDNSKIKRFVDTTNWMSPDKGLARCLNEFLKNPQFDDINWHKEALIDKAAGEWTPLWEIPGKKTKLRYLKWRILG